MLMQAYNAVGSNTPGAASSAADLEAQDLPKSRPKPEKIDVEKQHIFGIDFFTILIRFWEGPTLENGAPASTGARFLKNQCFSKVCAKNIDFKSILGCPKP